MPQIKKLKLKLKSGLLSELQSDTIFGHFCWRLKEQLGENALSEFIKYYQEDKPVFTISDGILEKNKIIYFKKPYLNSDFSPKSENKNERITNFLKQKEIKSRPYITLDQLNLFLDGDLNTYEKSFDLPGIRDLEIPKLKQDLRVSVEIDRGNLAAKTSQLFSYNPNYLDYEDNETLFVIFIKILDESKYKTLDCEEILKSVFEIGFGKKKSSGYGQFEVMGVEDFNQFNIIKEAKGFLSFGNYLPSSKDNLQNGFYDYIVKYGKLGENLSQSDNPFKKPIIFFVSGSCFYENNCKDFYGRVTDNSEISPTNSFAIQFGVPFILNFR
jgi:CRISPR-associated protein Csm4